MKQFFIILTFSFFYIGVHGQVNVTMEKESFNSNIYNSYNYRWGRLVVNLQEDYELEIFPITNEVVKVSLRKNSSLPDSNKAVKPGSEWIQMDVEEDKEALHITSGFLTMDIQKKNLLISYYYKGELLTKQNCFEFQNKSLCFDTKEDELFYGLGSQIKSNSLNGYFYDFDNKGIIKSTSSIPVLFSTKKYLVFFDNSWVQSVDITNSNKIEWKLKENRFSYYLIGGKNYRSILKSYFQLVGRQDIPPRYLMGAVSTSVLKEHQLIWDSILVKVWNKDTLLKKKIDSTNLYLKYQAANKEYRRLYSQKRMCHIKGECFIGSTAYSVCSEMKTPYNSWNTLQSFVPQMLHSSVSGLPYAHIVAHGNKDEELGLAILQVAAFSPLFIYEAMDYEAYSGKSKVLINQFVEEREKLKPYFYTLAWQQATLGDLLVKPSFFNYSEEMDKLKYESSFLVGNNLLLSPVLKKNSSSKKIYLPKGKWYDYHSLKRYEGGQSIRVNVEKGVIPIFVKGGTFLPKVSVLKPYKLDSLWLTYFPVGKDGTYNSRVYEDDGETPNAWKSMKYEIMNFQATEEKALLSLVFRKHFFEYQGRIKKRQMIVNIIRNGEKIKKVYLKGKKLKMKEVGSEGSYYTVNEDFITIYFVWDDRDVVIEVKY